MGNFISRLLEDILKETRSRLPVPPAKHDFPLIINNMNKLLSGNFQLKVLMPDED
jgi:hypothetical protein